MQITDQNILTSTFVNGLKTTVDEIILEEVSNKEVTLPETFNFENIKRLFEDKWKIAFRSPLPLIQPQNYTLLHNNRNVLKELFDFENPSRAFNFKAEIEMAFGCESFCQAYDIQDCHSYVIRYPIRWWNEDNSYGLKINSYREHKTVNTCSKNLDSQTIECSVVDEKHVKIENLRTDLVVKDNFSRILFKAIKSILEASFAMHHNGYIHGDIRWPNVAYHDVTQSYLLIDFENVQKIDPKCHHPKRFLIDNIIKLTECKCFIRDLYYIRNHICDFSFFPRYSDERIVKLFDDLKSILDIRKIEEWNENVKENLFKLL